MRLGPATLVVTFALGLLAGPLAAEAQQAGKVYRVGWLRFSPRPPTGPTHVAFRQKLHELGYVEGQNLVIEYRSAKGKPERRLEMAAELVRLKVDVIVVSPAPPMIRAAQKATQTIPILMAGVYVDPVEAGFVDRLARPGGNITGITNFESALHGKRLELLKEAFPRISRVAILWPRYQQKLGMKEFEAARQALGIHIQSLVTTGGIRLEKVERNLSAISRERPDALIVASSALIIRYRARIREFTAKRRLPAMYTRRFFVNAGGLMSYGANLLDMYRRTATYYGER